MCSSFAASPLPRMSARTCWSIAIPTWPSSSRSTAARSGATARCGCSAATMARRRRSWRPRIWSRNAGAALGIEPPAVSPHDYIATLIAWRPRHREAMCERIEAVHGRHWVEVVASVRKILRMHDLRPLCRRGRSAAPAISTAPRNSAASTGWARRIRTTSSAASSPAMAPEQVAIGMQSFIGTDIARIRRLIGLD